MPDTETLTILMEFLRTGGGWALSLILMFAIAYLYRTTGSLLEQRNDALKALIADCIKAITDNSNALDNLGSLVDNNTDATDETTARVKENTDALREMKEHLRQSNETLQRVKLLLEDIRR